MAQGLRYTNSLSRQDIPRAQRLSPRIWLRASLGNLGNGQSLTAQTTELSLYCYNKAIKSNNNNPNTFMIKKHYVS